MKRLWVALAAFIVSCFVFAGTPSAVRADTTEPPATTAQLEQRVKDLEAYVNNGARVDEATSKIATSGPGHNGFMMICAALVLFMTLPGLALFYGGLVRSKNVLSIMAQCMGIAGVVTLLWWAFGYSVAFSHGSAILGGFSNMGRRQEKRGRSNENRNQRETEHRLSLIQLRGAEDSP